MLIERLLLENIKSHQELELKFERGTIAISGPNGSGKTTILEAIGYALFNFLPYKRQEQIVREGAKSGRIWIELVGNNGARYGVERICGKKASWIVHDLDQGSRVEQGADVLYKLHEILGVEQDLDLSALFRDAIGVPQGTFTSIFLETPSRRKPIFDLLLRIESYKQAFEDLKATKKCYEDQQIEQRMALLRIENKLADLPLWQTKRQSLQIAHRKSIQRDISGKQRLGQLQEQLEQLQSQQKQLEFLLSQHTHLQEIVSHTQERLQDYQIQLEAAQSAQQILAQTKQAYQTFEATQQDVTRLRADLQRREQLVAQMNAQQLQLTGHQKEIEHLQHELDIIAQARKKLISLGPKVEQQEELEKFLREKEYEQKRYKEIIDQGTDKKGEQQRYKEQFALLEREHTELIPLVSLADQLPELTAKYETLSIQAKEYTHLIAALQTLEQTQQKDQSILNRYQAQYAEVNQKIARLEKHRAEIEAVPALEERLQHYITRGHYLLGQRDGYKRSRAESLGGQCPLLHERCLNIAQQGIVSLESYFDGLLQRDSDELRQLQADEAKARTLLHEYRPYAEEFARFAEYQQRGNEYLAEIRLLEVSFVAQEKEHSRLTERLHVLTGIENDLARASLARDQSKQASEKTRNLPLLQERRQRLEEKIAALEIELSELRTQVSGWKKCEQEVTELKASLQALLDPRREQHILLEHLLQEPATQERLQAEKVYAAQYLEQLSQLTGKMQAFVDLDQRLRDCDQILRENQANHQRYIQHIPLVEQLAERQKNWQAQHARLLTEEKKLSSLWTDIVQLQETFDPEVFLKLKAEGERLRGELYSLAEEMKHQQIQIQELELRLEQAAKDQVELEEAKKEYATLVELLTELEHFRKLIKEAGPSVMKTMLREISTEANRIFGEMLGDRSATLSWENDYEIILRRTGVERTFAQLSGGEQMCAALSVRLALLKKLTTLNIAFFDEPTQNMDEPRRSNFAEQIRRIRGFHQLIVISHDDTFDSGLDQQVRLQKEKGETRLIVQDEYYGRGEEEILYAS